MGGGGGGRLEAGELIGVRKIKAKYACVCFPIIIMGPVKYGKKYKK